MITAGMTENGQTVAVIPGSVLIVALDGAADGMWHLTQGDAMIVQPLGDWQMTPNAADATQAVFQRAFLGVTPGTADLQFEFMNADGSMAKDAFALTVDVPAAEPGSSGAVAVTEADAAGESALVVGDTLVVRLPANPTTGYDWRVVSTNDALLPAAGEPVYAVSSDLTGAGGVYTFRFLAAAPGEAAVQLGEYAPGAEDPDKTLDFNATIVDPAPLTGNTVMATVDDVGKAIDVAAGDWFSVELESNPSTGYLWLVTANDGAVLRLLPESGYTGTSDMPGAPGMQHFAFRALTPGAVDLAIGLFPPGGDTPEQVVEYAVTVK
jgi:inhibitor of cysteine peptidase